MSEIRASLVVEKTSARPNKAGLSIDDVTPARDPTQLAARNSGSACAS
jgi:hypothetical protein